MISVEEKAGVGGRENSSLKIAYHFERSKKALEYLRFPEFQTAPPFILHKIHLFFC